MDSDDEFDLEGIRAKNVAHIKDMFGDVFAEAEHIVNEVKEDLNFLTPQQQRNSSNKRKRNEDSLFHFTGSVPTNRRSSARLSKLNPTYTYQDLDKVLGFEQDDDEEYLRSAEKDYYVDLEEIIGAPATKRKSSRVSLPPVFRMPDEYSENELKNIAMTSGNKNYSQSGTSCHQCRQKTLDTKTVCRSGRCIGVRGQFCGPCLKNRYGENARDALLNPVWACPPCRNLCNCSICRTRAGKRPTGILAPTIQKEGYVSVKDFLLNLAEKGILSKNVTPKSTYRNQSDDDPVGKECSSDVIDILIKSYVEKLTQKHISCEFLKVDSCADLIGFSGNQPIYYQDEMIEGDLFGFVKTGNCIVNYNDVLYQIPLNKY